MKATHLWFAALAVLASFLAAVPTDARPAPAGLPSPSDLENLNPLNSLRRLENLIDLNVPDHGPRREHLFDLNMPPSPSSEEVEVVRSGLGSGAGEGSSHPPPSDGPRPANVLPQSAEAAHQQLGATQRAVEKRPIPLPDGTSLAHDDRGDHSNSPAVAYPTTDTRLSYLATHGQPAAREKRPVPWGNAPALPDNELAAGKRLKTALSRNDKGPEAARLVLDAVKKGVGRAKIRLGDEQLANKLIAAIGATIGGTLQDKVRFVASDNATLRKMGQMSKLFESLRNGEDPRRMFVNDASQGFLIVLRPRPSAKIYQEPTRPGEKAYTAVAFRADDWLRGKRDRTALGELFVPESTVTGLEYAYYRELSFALERASAGLPYTR